MIKVLVDGLPRTVGGIGSLIMNIVDKSREIDGGFEFEFLVPSGSRYFEILENRKEKYYAVPPVSKTSEYKEAITKIVTDTHYDYLWFNNSSKVNVYLPRIAKKAGNCKIIAHIHGMSIETSGKRKIILTALDRLHGPAMYKLIDIPLACSHAAADHYFKNKKLLERSTVIFNGIETDKLVFSEADRKKVRDGLEISDGEVLLGAVGRLTAIKNYPFIINMMKDLPDNYILIIAGIGEDDKALQQMIDENGLGGKCRLLGLRTDIPQLLSAMDVFLLPSFSEGMPFSVIEAQASGLQCIISDTLSSELDITGLVTKASISGEPSVWAQKILQLPIGKNNRLEYSSKVREAGYDIDVACTQFTEILKKNMER